MTLRSRLKKSIKEAAKFLGISSSELTRNEYIRISVDTDIESRLNKEELNDIGGYTSVRDEF